MKGIYEGELHCRLTHGPSGSQIETDAPVDNMGRGQKFSPTDLLASALGACMMTIMAIAAQKHGIELKGSAFDIEKEMIIQPERRVGRVTVNFHMCAGIPKDKRVILERAAEACPVHKSITLDVDMPVSFEYPD